LTFSSILHSPPSAPAVGFYFLSVLAVLIVVCLIALVEMVVLQLVHWGNTRQSMRASLAMNIPSSLAGILLLVLFPQPNFLNLIMSWPILVIIEGIILIRLRPGSLLYNGFAVVLANLASYLILILPAFLFRG
jgi:hypothetical protein